jgi:hypothetical protein
MLLISLIQECSPDPEAVWSDSRKRDTNTMPDCVMTGNAATRSRERWAASTLLAPGSGIA